MRCTHDSGQKYVQAFGKFSLVFVKLLQIFPLLSPNFSKLFFGGFGAFQALVGEKFGFRRCHALFAWLGSNFRSGPARPVTSTASSQIVKKQIPLYQEFLKSKRHFRSCRVSRWRRSAPMRFPSERFGLGIAGAPPVRPSAPFSRKGRKGHGSYDKALRQDRRRHCERSAAIQGPRTQSFPGKFENTFSTAAKIQPYALWIAALRSLLPTASAVANPAPMGVNPQAGAWREFFARDAPRQHETPGEQTRPRPERGPYLSGRSCSPAPPSPFGVERSQRFSSTPIAEYRS